MTSFVLQGHICFISHLLQVTDAVDVQCIVNFFLNDEIYIFFVVLFSMAFFSSICSKQPQDGRWTLNAFGKSSRDQNIQCVMIKCLVFLTLVHKRSHTCKSIITVKTSFIFKASMSVYESTSLRLPAAHLPTLLETRSSFSIPALLKPEYDLIPKCIWPRPSR